MTAMDSPVVSVRLDRLMDVLQLWVSIEASVVVAHVAGIQDAENLGKAREAQALVRLRLGELLEVLGDR